MVRLLLDKGADVNAQDGRYGTALQAASAGGYEAVVRLLLNKGADINVQDSRYGTALQAASARGHEAVVRLLLNKGADINAQDGRYGTALQAASIGGHRLKKHLRTTKPQLLGSKGSAADPFFTTNISQSTGPYTVSHIYRQSTQSPAIAQIPSNSFGS